MDYFILLHELRDHVKSGNIALVSVSRFTEMDNFNPLITHVKAMSKNMSREFVGSLLRPNAWILNPAQEQGAQLGDIIEAIKDAGKQLITEGKMKEETLAIVASEIISRDEVITMMQGHYGDK